MSERPHLFNPKTGTGYHNVKEWEKALTKWKEDQRFPRKIQDMPLPELLELKEWYRVKHGLYIENDLGERGTRNHKTKPYWGCSFKKRGKHPRTKGKSFNYQIVYGTKDSFEEAVRSSLELADRVLETIQKNIDDAPR